MLAKVDNREPVKSDHFILAARPGLTFAGAMTPSAAAALLDRNQGAGPLFFIILIVAMLEGDMNCHTSRLVSFGAAITMAMAGILIGLSHTSADVPVAVSGATGELPTLAPIVDKIAAGVVNIAIKGRMVQENNPLLNDPLLRRFLNIPKQPAKREITVAGSGVIFDAREGLIITSNHVIEHADEITVTLTDRRKLQAKRVGADPETDVAVIKVQAENLVAIPLGDSDRLRVGDFVIAIGNPFQIGQTVTSGVVSGLRREGLGIEQYEDFIQTDASINPGSSGGALVNLRGELIGISTAIVTPDGANIGIGFAIPVNMVRAAVDQIVKFGDVRHGRLGISIDDITPDLIRKQKLADQETGAIIAKIDSASPAERSGLKVGDVVTEIGSRPVRDASDLRNKIGQLRPGETAELKVVRDSRTLTFSATLAEHEQPAKKKRGKR